MCTAQDSIACPASMVWNAKRTVHFKVPLCHRDVRIVRVVGFTTRSDSFSVLELLLQHFRR